MPNDLQPLLASAYWDYSRKAVISQTVPAPFAMTEQEQQQILDMQACYRAVPWLFRGVQLRADAVAKMPFRITKKGSKAKEPVDASADYQNALGFLPNPVDFLWRAEAAAAIWGSAYFWRAYNTKRTLSLRYLLPMTITPEIDEEEGLVGFTRYVNGQPRPATAADIVYLWRPDPFVELGPPISSPVQAALSAANVLLNVDLFAAAFFQRGAIKATLLTVEGNPPKTEREALKSWWERLIGGIRNAFSTEVVSASVKPVQIGEGINDLANTTLTDEKKSEIAVAMGVPRSIMDSSSAAGLGGGGVARQDDKHFYDKVVLPEGEWLQAQLNEQVFHPVGYHWEFMPEALEIYQDDEAGLATSFKLYVDAGLPKSLAAKLVGIELPPGWEYEDLDALDEAEPAPAPVPAPEAAPALPAAPDDDEDDDQQGDDDEPAAPRKAIAPAAPVLTPFERDLRAWRSKSKRKGKVAAFESDAIPAQIADAVKLLGQDDWRRGFSWLAELQTLKAKREPDREAEAALRDDITALLTDWRRRFAEAIANGDSVAYEALNDELRLLIGPYLVMAVLDSYMAQAALMGVVYDITLVNIAALQWANLYSYELIKGINATTQTLVSEVVAQFIATPGMTVGDIEALLERSFGEVRAEMIAITETTRAYSQGTRVLQDLLRQSGVDMVRVWKTANDGEKVCVICRPLEGKTEDEWPDDLKDGPPGHVKCRCGATLRLRKPAKSVIDWPWPFSMTRWATDDDLATLGAMVKGGPGSGNWGHAGRPGVRGGSAPGGGLAAIGVDHGSSRADRVKASLAKREKRGGAAEEKQPLKPWQMTGEQVRAELAKIDTSALDAKIAAADAEIAAANEIIKDWNSGKYGWTSEGAKQVDDASATARARTAEREALLLERGALGRNLIYAETPGTVEMKIEAKSKPIVNTGQLAMSEFNRMVGDKEFPKPVVLVGNRTSRANAWSNTIAMNSKDGVRTHIHEIGHVYENFKPGVREKAFAFVNSRTAGEKSVSLRKFTGANYRSDEVAKPDSFIHPYVGKTYGTRSTEVISMGFEHMWADPVHFAKGDPGHFDLIWNIMRGN